MNVTTVSITVKRKFNLGNYESVELGATVWADIEPADNLSDCTKALWAMASENIKAQAMPLLAKDAESRELANTYRREYMAGVEVVNGSTPTNNTH